MRKTILDVLHQALITRTPLDALPDGVWTRTGALNTWGTNAIEGNTLSREDVERLLLERQTVGNRPVSDVVETLQHASAFAGLLARRAEPIRATTARELHEAVFRGVHPDAGQWRRMNVRIAGMKHVPPRMEHVPLLMSEWEESYAKRDLRGEDPLSLGSSMHFEFESVHPFADGNGRVGRLLLNLHFLKHNWPPVHVLPMDRDSYLAALVAGHAGDLAEMEGFLRAAMARSLLDLLDQVGTKEDALTPLRSLARKSPHSAKYLGLRSSQGELPAVKVAGDWQSSERALLAYLSLVGRG